MNKKDLKDYFVNNDELAFAGYINDQGQLVPDPPHKRSPATVYLIGAGPGDPELLTVKAKRIIENASYVLYDGLVNSQLFDLVNTEATVIYVGKAHGSDATLQQQKINDLLVNLSKRCEGHVVRLKGGDPFVFGRGGEEILALEKEHIPYKVIPGISSSIAALSSVGIPITHRGVSRSFQVVTGHTYDHELADDLKAYAKAKGTLVILMGVANIERISQTLLENGKDPNTPATIIESATTIAERRIDTKLSELAKTVQEQKVEAPAIFVLGEVCQFQFRDHNLPYDGINFAVTGTLELSRDLCYMIEHKGGNVLSFPTLRVQALDPDGFGDAINASSWLAFTSANGVRIFKKLLKSHRIDVRSLHEKSFAVVGKGTKRALLDELGIIATMFPTTYDVESLAKALGSIVTSKEQVCILRSNEGSPILNQVLEEKGIKYIDLAIYHTQGKIKRNSRIGEIAPLFKELSDTFKHIDYAIFTSSRGVKSFFEDVNATKVNFNPEAICVAIGEPTAKTLRECLANLGTSNEILVAKEYSRDGIIKAIDQRLENK